MTEYLCRNYQPEFCNDDQAEEVSDEKKQKLTESINELIGEVEKFKEVSVKKFDIMKDSLEGVLHGFENNIYLYGEVSKNLEAFQEMFNNTIS